MAVLQKRANRKPTGGRYKALKIKKQHELGRMPALTKIEDKTRAARIRLIGGNEKIKLWSTNKINVYDPKSKKHSKAVMKGVLENPANRHFIRRNILTKGSVVDTDKGKARITSRPGQDGTINAVLV